MHTSIELNVFSGLQNPRWELSSQQEAEFDSKLQSLNKATGSLNPKHPSLGYRGWVVEHVGPDLQTEKLSVFNGTVERLANRLSDPHRCLEKWLLTTGSQHLDPVLYERMKEELAALL